MTTPTTILTTTAKTFRALPAVFLAACLSGLLLAPAAGAEEVCGDVNADGKVTTVDALGVLKTAVGQPTDLICEDECAVLEARVAALEALLANVTIQGDNFVLTGMNFQVVSGSGDTDGVTNGTGNIIIGYDESDDNGDDKTGSHNLVVGRDHNYTAFGGIVAGEDNSITGEFSSVLGGTRNSADGDDAVVVGGDLNEADGITSAVLAGESNRAAGRSCSVTAGVQNLCTGIASNVTGGSLNFVSGNTSVIGGGSSRVLGGPSASGWVAATLGPLY